MTDRRPTAPLSTAERRVWRGAAWLLTGACGALTVSGLLSARAPISPTSLRESAAGAVAEQTTERPAAPAPKRRCS